MNELTESPIEERDGAASRRRFIATGLSAAAAALAGARPAGAQQGGAVSRDARSRVRRLLDTPSPGAVTSPLRGVQLSSKGWDSALSKLVRRITNGVTPEELTLARKLGFNGYLEYHLNWYRIDDSQVQDYVAQNFPMALQGSAQLYDKDQGTVKTQFYNATLYRAAFSKRQLYERMVEFWSDHFNIEYDAVDYMKVQDDRDVVRPHALGKFPDMLRASAHSPAMLEYLDNTRNRGNSPNQNYARELMELHTVGVNGGYTQEDVAELSRCLTGWTMQPRGVGFYFDPNIHDFGAKRVMGQFIAAQPSSAGQLGKRDGDTMIAFLVAHPSTARFIATKMLRWLLRYDPSQAQIDAVAQVYADTGGDIPAMIRAILTPANLLAAPPKYRRPYSYVLAALRATRPNMLRTNAVSITWLNRVGQLLFAWAPPDGYPDTVEYWAGGVLQRWNFATYLTTNTSDAVVNIDRFLATPTPAGLVDAISSALFGGEMPDGLRVQLLSYAQAGTLTQTRAREVLALALGSSAFQWI